MRYLQLDDGLADPQHAAHGHLAGLGEARRAEEGAVRGAEVLDRPRAVVGLEDAGVPAGDVVVVEDQDALGAAADERAGGAQWECRAGQRSGGDDEPGRARPRRTCAPDGSCAPRAAAPRRPEPSARPCRVRRAALDPRAVEVAAQHADDREHEDPQQHEETQAHEGEGDLAQHAPVTAVRRGT